MPPLPCPLQSILVALAGWINQQQREVIDYLQTENRVLREQLGPRRLRFTPEPESAWVQECARQLTDPIDGCLRGKRFLLHDRDPLFSKAFRETLAATGVETVRLPARSPNLNALAERFVRTIKESSL